MNLTAYGASVLAAVLLSGLHLVHDATALAVLRILIFVGTIAGFDFGTHGEIIQKTRSEGRCT